MAPAAPAAPAPARRPARPERADRWQALLRDYLRWDTSNPANVAPALAWLARALPAEAQVLEGTGTVLVARLAGGLAGKELVLLHHADTVAAGGGWRHPPFAAEIERGFVHARGALDDKAIGIAQLAALHALARVPAARRRSVLFVVTPDEESGSRAGLAALLAADRALLAGAGAVITEGGSNEVIGGSLRRWGIEVAQKHPVWLRVRARASGGHAAMPAPSDAPARLVRALARLEEAVARQPWHTPPEVAAYFRAAAPGKPGARGGALAAAAAGRLDAATRAALPASAAALLHPTLAVTRLAAGHGVNMLPELAEAELDVRLPAAMSAAAGVAMVRDGLGDPGLQVETLLAEEGSPASPQGAVYREIAAVLGPLAPGAAIVPMVSPAMTEARFFRRLGIPAYGFSPFAVGPFDGGGVHGRDERIELGVFAAGVRVMTRLVDKLAQSTW